MTYIMGTAAADWLTGTSGDDVIEGLGDNDILYGQEGADILRGGAGDDYMYGGAGSDRLEGGGGTDSLNGEDGDDSLFVGLGRGRFSGGIGNDRLEIDGGAVRTDTWAYGFLGDGVDEVFLDYSAFSETVLIMWSGYWTGTKTVYAYAGDNRTSNQLAMVDGVEKMSVTTGSGNDYVSIISSDGVIRTGAGNDKVFSERYSQWATLGGSADGGEGIDRAVLNWSDLGAGQSVVYDTADPAGAVVATAAGDRFLRGFEILEEFHSGQGNDQLTVHSVGLAGVSQSIYSEGGDDIVTIVVGAQPLGDYFSIYMGDQAGDHLIVDFRASAVDAYSYGSVFEQGGKHFINAYTYWRQTVFGSDHDDYFNDGGTYITNDVFYGGDGDDHLRNFYGEDEAHGGAGTDRLEVELYSTGIAGMHFVAGGTASSDGLGGYEGTIALYGGSVRYSSIEDFTVNGSSGADHVIGADGDDILYGSYGGDTLEGGAGDDFIDGGLQSDRMVGGTGDDIYISDGDSDETVEVAGEGIDEVRTAQATHVLAANVEKLTAALIWPWLTEVARDFRGNDGDNVIAGGSSGDVLRLYDGGVDTVLAGGGDDSIFFIGTLTSADLVNGGTGTDTLVLQGSYGALILTANVTQIENISILAGSNTNFGEPGTNRYDYVLTTNDANFAAGVQARINGAALLEGEDFTFDGSAETNASFVVYGGKGRDTLLGGLGNDIFFYAEERFASGDTVNGGAGYDGMFLRGNYTIDFNAPGYTGLFTNIENLTLTSATDERYARGGGTEFDYNLILSDAIVNAGQQLTVSGALLMASETMVLDASQETNGSVRLFGGAANDSLKGGANADYLHGNLGADILAGGGGADSFRYQSAAESTSVTMDQILDFRPGTDKIELDRIDARTNLAGDQAFTWIGSNAFSGSAGQLRAYQQGGTWFVEGDVNGDSIADLVIALTLQGPTPLGAGDFLL